jgi:hypothetical protein
MRRCRYCEADVLFTEGIGWRTEAWGITCPKAPTYSHYPSAGVLAPNGSKAP